MQKKDLIKAGVPLDSINLAIGILRDGRLTREIKKNAAKKLLPSIVAAPEEFVNDPVWGTLAHSILGYRREESADEKREPIAFKQWGGEMDKGSRMQMEAVCQLPVAVAAAVMPDFHLGYGICIGGVLALKALHPYAVGSDIACRMRVSIVDLESELLTTKPHLFIEALEKETNFGTGKEWQNRKQHAVLDRDWKVTRLTAGLKDTAWAQLGTSGSSNHFADFCLLTLDHDDLGLKAGRYVALMTHSGSRGAGYNVCQHDNRIAQRMLPKRYEKEFKWLAWLDPKTQEGDEYWHAMNLMGDYASANHEVIHRDVIRAIGGTTLCVIENHHNFAWKEMHNGEEVYVHRKGATPAHKGTLGVIPGSMGDSAYIVRGLGNPDSINSASHGAGRRMSRAAARDSINVSSWKHDMAKRGIILIGGGVDEAPNAYKPIEEVMMAQADLVERVACLEPKIVIMSSDEKRRGDD